MNPLFLSAVGKNFKSIQSGILKIVKIKDQEKLQKKFDDTRAKQQSYKSRYQQSTQVKKISVKSAASGILDGLVGMLKALFTIIGIAGLFSILKSTGVGKYILDFIKNTFSAIVDLIQKGFRFIRDVLFDSEVQSSLQKLVTTFFSFVGTLIVAAVSLASALLRDNEVLDTLKKTIVAIFDAIIEGIKASYNIISQLVIENIDTIKQTASDVFVEIKNAIILSLGALQNALTGGLNPRISDGLKEIFVASWNFIADLFTTEFKDVETGKNFSLAEKSAIWVVKLAGLGALWLVLTAKLFGMGRALSALDLSQNCGICMDDDRRRYRRRGKTNIPRNKDGSKDGFRRTKESLIRGKDYVVDKSQKVVKFISEKARIINEKFSRGLEVARKNLKKYADSIARYVKVMAKKTKVQSKIIAAVTKRFGSAVATRISIFLAAQAAAIIAAPVTGGLSIVAGLLMAGLMVYDIYCLYHVLFVSSDGENEDGGLAPSLKSEIDESEKAEISPIKVPEQAAPAPIAVATTKSKRSRYNSSSSVSASPSAISPPSSAPIQMNASAPSASPSPAPDYPANWTASPMGIPAGVEVEKRQVGGLGYRGPRKKTDGVIIHHTGGRGLDTAIQRLQQRKLSYHYLVDRNGKVVQIVPDELRASHAGVTNKKPGFNNDNTVSISMVAKDDTDVTPEQIASASSLEAMLAKKYGFPKTNAFGHGEVSSSKHPQEGYTIASAIRSGRVDQAIESVTEKSLEDIKQNAPPSVNTQTTAQGGDILGAASNQVSSGLRMLEDLFLSGRPSFTDFSTTVNQSNTISRPGGNLRAREEQAIRFLLERQSS